VEWLKVKSLSSNPCTTKEKNIYIYIEGSQYRRGISESDRDSHESEREPEERGRDRDRTLKECKEPTKAQAEILKRN
jgi:hypothetical protein